MADNGHNPLRWDCEERGCFNKLRRPKLEVFADCFQGRINFGDVDGLVEINGHFLFLEWKSTRGEIPTGQWITFEKITKSSRKTTVVCVSGNAETMEIEAVRVFKHGASNGWESCSLDELKGRMRAWADRARGTP